MVAAAAAREWVTAPSRSLSRRRRPRPVRTRNGLVRRRGAQSRPSRGGLRGGGTHLLLGPGTVARQPHLAPVHADKQLCRRLHLHNSTRIKALDTHAAPDGKHGGRCARRRFGALVGTGWPTSLGRRSAVRLRRHEARGKGLALLRQRNGSRATDDSQQAKIIPPSLAASSRRGAVGQGGWGRCELLHFEAGPSD